MFQTTRRRLALYYTIVTAVLLIIFAMGIYGYVYKTLIDRIDDTLKHVMEIVEPSLVIDDVSWGEGKYKLNVNASFRQHPDTTNKVEDDHIDLEWFSPNGELLWQTLEQPLPIPLSFHSGGKTIRISSDYLLRQITKRIEVGRYVLGYLRVSHPLFDVIKPIRQLITDLIIGVTLMIASVAAIGWFLSGIAIQPVKESYQSLKQFTADASHELRNPIATIKTNIQTLLAYPEIEPEQNKKQLEIVDRLTERLSNLVNDLLFLARSDSGIINPTFQSIPLDSLLLEVVEEQILIAQEKSINLSLEIIDNISELNLKETDNIEDLFTIEGDWGQLSRLFTNLISNAIIHGFKTNDNQKSTIQVILKVCKKNSKLSYKIQIKDNGMGIEKENIPLLFDRFYRGDSARSYRDNNNSNTGLGLAIARAIVESHHGNIKVESNAGEGTNFMVTLPKKIGT
ncbi:sensor histidine kinase [Cyanobacterium sp. IPPAS B-1200]|uniref:sensor histidine kinase n=1 Tax=Cyanobacterium sp. IPPAS B-1200 TaxID=1562720 RepID=UPI0008526140|nr:HAMP domain-containing sensor histidine kinase [Cyanobacterium sp. IPPAS B-1200]OEJ78223.1 two-component sensor histidine kinase [Cyanobacterium sp. IPPAS B-1200]